MMAQAPMLPSSGAPPTSMGSAPPLVPPSQQSELKTMMAQAPVLPSGGGNEAKTMMAQAPILPSSPPPGGRPQQPAGNPGSDARTMIAQAPSVQVSPQGQASAPQGTMMLPDSAGVVAFAAAQAVQARSQAANIAPEPVKPAGPLFWTAWVVLGIGIGLAIHFIQVHQQLSAMAIASGHS